MLKFSNILSSINNKSNFRIYKYGILGDKDISKILFLSLNLIRNNVIIGNFNINYLKDNHLK